MSSTLHKDLETFTHGSSGYPRVYRASAGARAVAIVAGLVCIAGSIVAAFYISRTEPRGWLILLALCGCFALLGAALIADTVKRKLTLHADAVEMSGLFSVRHLDLRDIAGRRLLRDRNPRAGFVIVPRDHTKGRITIPSTLRSDRRLREWVGALTDLDARELRDSEAEVLGTIASGGASASAGGSLSGAAAREAGERLRRAKRLGQGLAVLTWPAAAWLWFYPYPYRLAVTVVGALPLVAMFVVYASRGVFRFDVRRNDAHPSVAVPFFMPGFVLALRLLSDPIRLVDWRLLLLQAVALAVALTALALLLDRSLRERSWRWLPVGFITMVYSYAALMDWNALADFAAAHRYETHVLGKYVSHGRHTSWHLDLGPWGPDAQAGRETVARWLYDAVSVGDKVCVDVHPGRMRIGWYSIGLCRGRGSAAAVAVAPGTGKARGTGMPAPPSSVPVPRPAAPAPRGDLVRMLAEGRYADLEQNLGGLQRSYSEGTLDDVGLMSVYRVFYDADPAFRARYDEWVLQYPDSYPARLARGIFEKYIGRGATGDGLLNQSDLSRARAQAAREAFDAAWKDLNASLALDAHAVVSYVHLIDLAPDSSGALFGSSEKRKLLDEGLGRNPMSFVIRRKYMSTLETWRGHSSAEMQQFLEEVSRSGLTPVQLDSLDALVLRDRGRVAERAGNAAAALNYYKQAAAEADEAPELLEKGIYADILIKLGGVYMTSANYAQALEQFDKLLRFNQNMDDWDPGVIWANRGVCLWYLGDKAAAVAAFEKGSELGNPFARNELGKHYWFGDLMKQDRVKAVRLFEEAAAGGLKDGADNLYWAKSQLQ